MIGISFMNDSEFKQRFRNGVDAVLNGCEQRNVMQVLGGAYEVHAAATTFFDPEWLTATFARASRLYQWAKSPEGDVWVAQNIMPLVESFRGPQ
jgi:hypothetical protein